MVGVQHPEEIGLKKTEKVNFHGYLNHEELANYINFAVILSFRHFMSFWYPRY